MTEAGFTPRVFSGIQPSGGLTLGNYLGAMKRFVDMQNEGSFETIYCMVDLHAITVWQNPEALRHNTRELCAGFIAAGIDPERSDDFTTNRNRCSPSRETQQVLGRAVARPGGFRLLDLS